GGGALITAIPTTSAGSAAMKSPAAAPLPATRGASGRRRAAIAVPPALLLAIGACALVKHGTPAAPTGAVEMASSAPSCDETVTIAAGELVTKRLGARR